MLSDPTTLLAWLAGPEPDTDHEHVLDAARLAILDFGVRRTSMAEIARRSGVSPATLYRWFESKSHLVSSVILREARQLIRQLHQITENNEAPDVQLTEIAVHVAKRMHARPIIQRLLVTDPELILRTLTVDATTVIEMSTQYLAMLIRRYMDGGRVPEGDADAIAELLVRWVHSLTLTPTSSLPLNDEDRVREVVGGIVRGLLNMPSTVET